MMERPEIDLNVRVPTRIAKALADASMTYDLTTGEIIRQALQAFLYPEHDAASDGRIDDASLMARLHEFATGTATSSDGLAEFKDRLAVHNLEYVVDGSALLLRARAPEAEQPNLAHRPEPEANFVQSFGHFPGHPHRSAKANGGDAAFEVRDPKALVR